MSSNAQDGKTFYKFGIAALAVVSAAVVTLLIPALGDGGMYFLFLTAVIFSTLRGDWRSGVFAVVFSIVLNFFLLHYLAKAPNGFGDWLVLFAFGLAAGFTVFICHAQMRSETARRLAESRYRMIFEDAITGIYETTLDGRYAAANPKLAEMFGFESPAHLIENAVNLNEKFYVEADRRAEFARLVEEQGSVAGFESEIYRRDGATIWITENAVAVRDAAGKLIGFQGTTIEITARKLAEAALNTAHEELESKIAGRTLELARTNDALRQEINERQLVEDALRESEEKFRALVEVSSDFIWETDTRSVYTYASPKIKETLGYEPEEMLGKTPCDFLLPAESSRVWEINRRLTESRETYKSFFIVFQHKDGNRSVSYEIGGVPIYNRAGDFVGYRGVARDITERQRTENALRQSEEKFRTVVEISSDWIWEVNEYNVLSYVSPGIEDFLGYEPAELIGTKPYDLMPPEEAERMRKILKPLGARRESLSLMETVNLHKDGTPFVLESSAVPFYDSDGNYLGYRGITRDINERKRAAAALEKSEKRYRELVENARDYIYTVNFEGYYTSLNQSGKEFMDVTDEEVKNAKLSDIIAPEYHALMREKIAEKLAGKVTLYEVEIIKKDKQRVPLELNSWVIYEDGKPVGIQGIARNVAERKQTEAALRESEMHLRSVVTAAPLILFAVDAGGTITLSEGKGLDLLNLRAGEVVGRAVDEFFRETPTVAADVRRVLERGDAFTNLVTINGLTFETHYSPILDHAGAINGVIGVSIDMTESKRVENELLASQKQFRELSAHLLLVREEERKYIARELHDELGQALTALKIDLTKMLGKMSDWRNEATRARIAERLPAMLEIVDEAMTTTKEIVAELRPGVLDELGLAAAAEWQVREFQKRTGIKCELKINSIEESLSQDLTTAMFRILQECLTNISRHAAATEARIRLKKEQDRLRLEVEDNGRGISEADFRNTKSFGVLGMRERALLLGGSFVIERNGEQGTYVAVEVPLH